MLTLRTYSYSFLSVFLWVALLYLPCVHFSPRGHHLGEWIIWPLICCAVLVFSGLMILIYKLFSLIKKLSPLKKDIIFVLSISYLYLPIAIFTLYTERMLPSIFSMEMVYILFNIKLYLLGVVVVPAPLLFVHLLHRAERRTSQSKAKMQKTRNKMPATLEQRGGNWYGAPASVNRLPPVSATCLGEALIGAKTEALVETECLFIPL